MRYMLDKGMLVTGHGDRSGVNMVTCHDGVSPLMDTRPWVLAFNVDGPGKDIGQLRHAIGEKRIDDGIAKAEAFLNQDGSRVSCDTRFIPMGGGHDHVEELAWVPAPWRTSSHTPEALRSLGTPWLLSHDIAAQRKDGHHWPVPGFGHFLSAQRGDMLACVIPCEPLMERGSSMKDALTFLCNWPWSDFEKFMYTHCLFADVTPGCALWIPYGWRCVLLTRTNLSVSHVLHIPYVCTRMLRAAHRCDDILDYAMQAAHDWASHMGMEPCVSLAKEYVAWLAKFGTSVSGTPECAPATPMALEDGHA